MSLDPVPVTVSNPDQKKPWERPNQPLLSASFSNHQANRNTNKRCIEFQKNDIQNAEDEISIILSSSFAASFRFELNSSLFPRDLLQPVSITCFYPHDLLYINQPTAPHDLALQLHCIAKIRLQLTLCNAEIKGPMRLFSPGGNSVNLIVI